MNVQAALQDRVPVKLTVDNFLLLRRANAFALYSKAELLEGELWGVPLGRDEEPDYDASFPIKLTVDQYEMLDASGAFHALAKTELIDGLVYEMSPQHRPHGFVKDELAYRLRRALEAIGSTLHVATEQSVVIPPNSEPQPDIILTFEPKGDGGIPIASVTMLVEVADTTRKFDLFRKASVYAAAGVPEYWVADVNGRVIHQLWAPAGEAYAERREVAFAEVVEAVTIAGLSAETGAL